MTYTGLMLDVDGTLIPYLYEALPSEKVVDAIGKAKENEGNDNPRERKCPHPGQRIV